MMATIFKANEPKRQGHSWGLTLLAALLLTACHRNGEEAVPPPPPPREVTTGQVTRQDIEIRSQVVGVIAPWRQVSVAPETTGTVLRLPVEMGDPVMPGQTLFTLDTTDAELAVAEADAQLESAQATLVEAEASHRRIEAISRNGVASANDLDAAVRTLGVARAAALRAEVVLNQARERLADCTVTSPITGEVTIRHIELGALLQPGTPAIEVAMLHQVKLRLEVTESERVNLRRGQRVPVHVGVLGDEMIEGTVHAMSAAADPMTLTFPVDIEIPNPDGRLLSGMIAHASILIETREDRLTVPLKSRIFSLDGSGVYVNDNSHARFHPVEFGERHGEIIEVLSGLEEGDVVLVDGADSLKPGTIITVIGEH